MAGAPRIAYVLDPRFPGGTSAAVAAELRVAQRFGQVSLHAIESAMFRGRVASAAVASAAEAMGLPVHWDSPLVAADLVLWHNPAFLKFQDTVMTRLVCRDLVVVTHENFLRPGGSEGFDAGACLSLIDGAALALRKVLAPVSPVNRRSIGDWSATRLLPDGWQLLPEDWFNICEFDLVSPTTAPADRRGRHSRPGLEKFPAPEVMDLCFPAHAERNVILGADSLMAEAPRRPHWTLIPFGGLDVARYFEMVDFMIYFTSPAWRESFGRVLAEALAAGKVAISDPGTAATFGGGVIGARPDEVDAIVARHIADPALYRAQVARGQAALARYSAGRFADMFGARVEAATWRAAARRAAA